MWVFYSMWIVNAVLLFQLLTGMACLKATWLPDQRHWGRGKLFSCSEVKRTSAISKINTLTWQVQFRYRGHSENTWIFADQKSWVVPSESLAYNKCVCGQDHSVGVWKYPHNWCLLLSRKFGLPWELLGLFWWPSAVSLWVAAPLAAVSSDRIQIGEMVWLSLHCILTPVISAYYLY